MGTEGLLGFTPQDMVMPFTDGEEEVEVEEGEEEIS